LIILALIHAKLELQIEGKAGWALRLPCWRISNKFVQLILGKELTGYHFYLLLLFAILFHSPILFISWTLQKECFILGTYCYYWIVEDWFWFLESKYYGIKNFKPGRIFWHKRWFIGLPVSYWGAIILGSIFFIIGGFLTC
jgi:hypothetical protein